MRNGRKVEHDKVVEFSQGDVTLSGWLKSASKLAFDKECTGRFIISFSNVRFLCSQVLSSLVEIRGVCRDFGAELVVLVNTKELEDLLTLVGFDRIMNIEISSSHV